MITKQFVQYMQPVMMQQENILQKQFLKTQIHTFWHYHKDCIDGRIPSTNTPFWKIKLNKTVQRDKKHKLQLEKSGWQVLTIWECDIELNSQIVLTKIVQYLKIHSI